MAKLSKKEAIEQNEKIAQLVKIKGANTDKYSVDELKLINQYVGYGGLGVKGDLETGTLYEFYTPKDVVIAMWRLVLKHGFSGGSVLEPACGTGRFVTYAPKDKDKYPMSFTCIEPSEISSKITKALNPNTIVINKRFEELFISNENNKSVKDRVETQFDLVIGNPPYGSLTGAGTGGGYYLNLGGKDSELNYTKAKNYIDYFILRGLDLLKPDGLLCFIIGGRQTHYLENKHSASKSKINQKAELIDAYLLPDSTFEFTDVQPLIVVFKKR